MPKEDEKEMTIYVVYKEGKNKQLLKIHALTFERLEQAQDWVEDMVKRKFIRMEDVDIAVGYKEKFFP